MIGQSVSISGWSFGATISETIAASANFGVTAAKHKNLFADLGVPGYVGPLAILISNVGANPANLLIAKSETANPTASVIGHQLKNDPANPILIADLDIDAVLHLRSTLGTTIEYQVGQKKG